MNARERDAIRNTSDYRHARGVLQGTADKDLNAVGRQVTTPAGKQAVADEKYVRRTSTR